ncbi:MAG: discoidin domain-containing protein, partial [Planctomycetota bacterium]
MRTTLFYSILVLTLVTSVATAGEEPSGQTGNSQTPAATSHEQIEADWLVQAEVRNPSNSLAKNTPLPYHIRPEQDAAGGCDGVVDGTWGFHTGLDEKPWWHVDLGSPMPLARAVITNTGYVADWKRALGFMVLLSDDGKAWTEVFRHDGTEFADPKAPITVDLEGARARLVRIQLPGEQHLTLEEIEVYPVGSDRNVALNKPADQSSSSQYSVLDYNPWSSKPPPQQPIVYPTVTVVERGLKLA